MRKLVLAAVLVLMAGGAQAATLNVIGGQLYGASGVLVDGNLYDVQFLDGTCIALYNGCDEASDFTFQTEASALLASSALLEQVFLDGVDGQFDLMPALTNGCSSPIQCSSVTPWSSHITLNPTPGIYYNIVAVAIATNCNPAEVCSDFGGGTLPDEVWLHQMEAREDTQEFDLPTLYAVWSPVPEPSTALLLGLGLVGMAGRRRV